MKKIILVLLIAVLLTSVAFSKVIIFIYHRFDDPRYPTTSTSSTELEMHIKMVKSMGFKIWSIKDLEDYIYSKKPMKVNAVVFTVDDGYRTVYTNGFPVFKKYKIPFTVFLYFQGIGHSKEYLTWSMIKEMKKYGATFGNHSYLHDKFTDDAIKMGKKRFMDYFLNDLKKGQRIFEEHMREKLRYYTYPYGYYNEEMIKILKDNGFKMAFTQMPGPFTRGISPFEIPREPLLQDWATKIHVEYILHREPLIVKGLPYYWKGGLFYVKADISFPKTITKAVVYIREKKIVKSTLNGSLIQAGPFELKNRYNSLMISVRDLKHHEHVLYFLIVKGDDR